MSAVVVSGAASRAAVTLVVSIFLCSNSALLPSVTIAKDGGAVVGIGRVSTVVC